MDGKQAISYFVTTLLVLGTFNILPTDGQQIICPWCDKKMESDLMNCVYIEMISRPQLIMMPLRDIDNIKWKLLSDSDSMLGMPYAAKKVAMDDKFVEAMAGAIKQNNYQSNPAIIDVVSELAGNCYSSVTGYDPNIVIQDIKRLVNENIEKSSAPLGGDPNPVPNSGMPYSANQKQQNNFQPSPQIQPSYVNDAPFNPPGSPPVNSFNNPSYGNDAPFNPPGSPPVNSFNNPSYGNDAPFNSPGSPPVNTFNNPSYGNDAPFNPPGSPPVNSFNNPSYGNDAPFNPPGSPPVNSFNNPSYGNDAPFNAPGSPPVNSFNNPSYGNDAPFNPPASQPVKPSSNNAAGQAGFDFSRNQAPQDGSSGTSLQNDNESYRNRNSQDNAALATTASPKSSSQTQDLKSTDSDNSDWTTPSPHTDAPQKKTTGDEDDEVACDEKFKIALYEKLINDDRFGTFFEKLPGSATKPAVLEIMNRAFKKYGIPQHFTEFSTFWKFDSKTLNKESKAENWDEVISKICKIIFSRNNLLKEDCEETGIKIADYILDVLPGDPPSTQSPNQNDGNDNTSTESNANSASNSTANASPENNSNAGNSTNSKNLSFPEMHAKLADMFKSDGSTEQDSDNVPFSETLSTFEAKQNLETLHRAAESCLSPLGFDFKKFMSTMSNVTDSILHNHPDWSRDKCQKEMYSATVAVMAELLQDTVKSSSNNAQSQPSSNQPDSAVDSSASQGSNSGPPPVVPNDYNPYPDDSTYPDPGTDYIPESAPQPPQDFTNYRDYRDGPGPENVPPYGNQPGPGDWNAGLTQPSNFAPGPVNTNYGNLQNAPSPANKPYDSNYGSQDYGPAAPQPMPQNFPSPDYSAIPPANMNTQPYSGNQPFPVNQNTGFQQSPDFVPNSGFMNSPNGNNQFQAENLGNNYGFNGQPAAGPALPNGNSQNFQPQNYDYGVPSNGPVIPNGNTQPGFNSNYNSRSPDNGPAIPQW